MKTNFKVRKTDIDKNSNIKSNTTNITKDEFEDFIIKSGASGSFMIFRSDKKDDEMGLEEL
jgi:hypothetical protein